MFDLSPSAQRAAGAQPIPEWSWRPFVLGSLVIVVLLAALVAAVSFVRGTEASRATVGDCVKRERRDSLAIVACDDPDVQYEVVGRVEDQTAIDAGLTSCRTFEAQGSTQAYWEGEQGGTGFVLCLAERRA